MVARSLMPRITERALGREGVGELMDQLDARDLANPDQSRLAPEQERLLS
jgi:hypothetical protein